MKNLKAQLSISFVCLILGLAVTIQIRSVKMNSQAQKEQSRVENVLVELNREKSKTEEMGQQIALLQADLARYQEQAASSGDAEKALVERANRFEAFAGLVALTGGGVTVTLDDSKEKNTNLTGEALLVHESDLLRFVNELCAAGAEAVSLNGERLVANSPIRCVGPVVTVNNTRKAAPFVLQAIGDPDAIYSALMMTDGLVEVYKNVYHLDVEVKKEKELTIPAYTGSTEFVYATPIKPAQEGREEP